MRAEFGHMQDEPQEIQALAQRILVKAAHKLGGVGALSKLLGVGEATLADWIAGRYVPPAEIILKAVSPLIDEPAEFWREKSHMKSHSTNE
jgi:hypothetical protein